MSSPEQTVKGLLDQSTSVFKEKERNKLSQKDFTGALKDLLEDVEKPEIKLMVEILFTMGNFETPLTKGAENDNFDKISQVLGKLVKIIQVMGKFGKLDKLNVYIAALKEIGINLSIDESRFPKLEKLKEKNVEEASEEVLNDLKSIQSHVYDLDAKLKEDAEIAKKINFVKSSYTNIVKLDYEKRIGRSDVEKKANDKKEDYSLSLKAVNFVMDKSND